MSVICDNEIPEGYKLHTPPISHYDSEFKRKPGASVVFKIGNYRFYCVTRDGCGIDSGRHQFMVECDECSTETQLGRVLHRRTTSPISCAKMHIKEHHGQSHTDVQAMRIIEAVV